MNTMQSALIRKDIRGITANKQLLVGMISVPIALTVVIPSIFIMLLHFLPNGLNNFDIMLRMLPTDIQPDNMNAAIISLLLNNIMPVFLS